MRRRRHEQALDVVGGNVLKGWQIGEGLHTKRC
jgi:hypothetical protein